MTAWAMTIDLDRCTGCSACVIDCKQKNATPREVFWKRLETAELGDYPDSRRVFLPVGCMHCEEPPCEEVCPTGATKKREDGIVHVDPEICIGCRACETACPYGARTFLESVDSYYDEVTPYETATLGSFTQGTVTKCDFCADRIDAGIEAGLRPGRDRAATPSCVNTCPADAVHFGDLDDPADEIHQYVSSPRAIRLKEEAGTGPNVHYLAAGPGATEGPVAPGAPAMTDGGGDGGEGA